MRFIKHYKNIIKVCLSALILAFLISKLDMNTFYNSLHSMNLAIWLIATPLVLLQLVLISFRWRHLANLDQTTDIGKIESIRICTLGAIANLLFINSIGGIVVRVALAMQHGLKLSYAIIAGLMDRFFTLAALIIISALLFSHLQPFTPAPVYKASGFMLIGFIASSLLFLPLLFTQTYQAKIFKNDALTPFMDFIKRMMTNPILLTKLLVYSLTAQTCYILSCYLVIHAMGIEIPVFALLALLPLITLVSSMPLGYGGWGVREGAFIVGLGFLDVSMETAFLVSIQIGMIGILSTIIAAVPFLLTQKGDIFKTNNLANLLLKKPQNQ